VTLKAPPLIEYDDAPVAIIVAVSPLHNVVPVADTVGNGITLTVTTAAFKDVHPRLLPITAKVDVTLGAMVAVLLLYV
jgi:hypothetical protein